MLNNVRVTELKSHSWKFEWLTKWEEVWRQEFVSQWERQLNESFFTNVFFSPSVMRAWADGFSDVMEIQPHFVVAYYNDTCAAILPLVYVKRRWKDAWLRHLYTAGYNEFDYQDPILNKYVEPEAWKSFWVALQSNIEKNWKNNFDIVSIRGTHTISLPVKHVWTQSEIAPFISLSKFTSVNDFFKQLSSKMRRDIIRYTNQLEKMGKLSHHVFESHEIDKAKISLNTMLEEHSRKWPRSYQVSKFYHYLLEYCLPPGILYFSELHLSDIPIGWNLGFIFNGRFYYYLKSYKYEYARYNLGKLHEFMSIKEAFKRELLIFDFLRGDEAYKSRWTDDKDLLFSWNWRAKTISSCTRIWWVNKIKTPISSFLTHIKSRLRSD